MQEVLDLDKKYIFNEAWRVLIKQRALILKDIQDTFDELCMPTSKFDPKKRLEHALELMHAKSKTLRQLVAQKLLIRSSYA